LFVEGSFIGLNAEEISEEVQSMWRNMHKLQKQFADSINPRKVADYTKHKIERFKNYVPVLQVICNPGLKDRHWKQVGSLRCRHCWLFALRPVVFQTRSAKL
jgi:dynein heavy chain